MSGRNIKSFMCLLIQAIVILLVVTSCIKEDGPSPGKPDPDLTRRDSLTTLLTNAMNADSIKSYAQWLEGLGTRFALADNHRTVARSIADKIKSLGLADTQLDSFRLDTTRLGHTYNTWQYNIVAYMHGSVIPDSMSVIGAHYDDINSMDDPFVIAPGADDNGSGTAATMEIIRVMVKNNFTPRGSISFVLFGAEELGLLGSKAYAQKAKIRGDGIIMMLNNDMISYEPDANSVKWVVNIISYPGASTLMNDVAYSCSRYFQIATKNDNTNYKRSDSYSFYLKGFKAVYFAAAKTNPYYHTSNDKNSNCNFAYCSKVAQISCSMLVARN